MRPGKGRNYARLSYGTYGTINAEAAVGGQASEQGSPRVRPWQHRNDWIDNLDEPMATTTSKAMTTSPCAASSSGSRPTDLTLRLTGQYRDLDGDARIFRANSIVRAATTWSASTAAISSATKSTDGLNFQDLTTRNVAGTIEYDFGPVTLYSVTSYWHGKLESRGDIDGGLHRDGAAARRARLHPLLGAEPGQYPEPRPVHPGIRIASNNTGGLGYQAGIFYFNENLDIESFDFGSPSTPTTRLRSSTSGRTPRPGASSARSTMRSTTA